MRKLFLSLVLGMVFVFPSLVSAQNNVTITSMTVQLWPEYDQPSMLVIVDFLAAADTPLPVDLTFRIPPDANLIAVASHAGSGNFMNSAFSGVKQDGEWQVFTMTLTVNTIYRFEYYQPLTLNGNQRIFSYLWDGVYAVDEFHISVLEPLDTVSLVMEPEYASTSQQNGLTSYDGGIQKLSQGEQFALNLQYEKTTNNLVIPPSQGLQPAAPVDENTPGRVSLNNSLPYLIGGVGVVMIVGGIVYYWQAGRAPSKRTRRRVRVEAGSEDAGGDSYCPQCGMRAKSGDRFCRICGARLRNQEE